MNRIRVLIVGVLTLATAMASGCGSDPTAAIGASSTAGPTSVAIADEPEPTTVPERSMVTTAPTTDAPTTDAPTTDAPTTDAPTTDAEVLDTTQEQPNGPFRLAPAASSSTPLLTWDRQAFQSFGHGGPLARIEIEGLEQVVAVPQSLPVFQTTMNERVIWQLVGDDPVPLIEVTEFETLTLEGSGLNADGEPVIFYQHRVNGSPEETRSTLRSFAIASETTTDIATTGGWESGVRFSNITSVDPGRDDQTVGLWGAEGWTWVEILALDTGAVAFDSQELGECFDGDEGCPNFSDAVIVGDTIVGFGPALPGAEGFIDALGLWSYHSTTGQLEMIESWPWDNGLWYVEDMFMLDDSVVVLSVEDGNGDPLPALSYDLTTGASWTEPDPGFVRPIFLS